MPNDKNNQIVTEWFTHTCHTTTWLYFYTLIDVCPHFTHVSKYFLGATLDLCRIFVHTKCEYRNIK